jgi:hypothetical protein
MKLLNALFFLVLACFATLALAQTLPGSVDAQVDYAKLIGELIANPKAVTAAFIGALIVLIFVQALKSPVFGKFFKSINPKVQLAIVTILGQLYGVILHVLVLKDAEFSTQIVGLFASGGAAAIFNAFKLLFEKPKAIA